MEIKLIVDKRSIIDDKTGVEGGYSNNPSDLGGETNHGITKDTAMRYEKVLVREFKWDGTMRNLSKDMAYRIYTLGYWDVMRLDEVFAVAPSIADQMFDVGINCGNSVSIEHLQKCLTVFNNKGTHYPDLVVDGVIGSRTIAALEAFCARRKQKGIEVLTTALLTLQGARYIEISVAREKNEEFTFGWMSRVVHGIDRAIKIIAGTV